MRTVLLSVLPMTTGEGQEDNSNLSLRQGGMARPRI